MPNRPAERAVCHRERERERALPNARLLNSWLKAAVMYERVTRAEMNQLYS